MRLKHDTGASSEHQELHRDKKVGDQSEIKNLIPWRCISGSPYTNFAILPLYTIITDLKQTNQDAIEVQTFRFVSRGLKKNTLTL